MYVCSHVVVSSLPLPFIRPSRCSYHEQSMGIIQCLGSRQRHRPVQLQTATAGSYRVVNVFPPAQSAAQLQLRAVEKHDIRLTAVLGRGETMRLANGHGCIDDLII